MDAASSAVVVQAEHLCEPIVNTGGPVESLLDKPLLRHKQRNSCGAGNTAGMPDRSAQGIQRALDHLRLPPGGELAGEEAGEVALQEAEDQDVADGRDGRDQDDGKGDEHRHVLRRLPDAPHLPRLERAPCVTAGETEVRLAPGVVSCSVPLARR